MGFTGDASGKHLPANAYEMLVISLDQKDPLEKGMATHSNILPWRIPLRTLVGYSPQGRKELNMIEAIKHTCTHSAYKLNKQGDNIQP